MDLFFVTCLTGWIFQGISIRHIVFLGIVLDMHNPFIHIIIYTNKKIFVNIAKQRKNQPVYFPFLRKKWQ